MHFLNHGSDSLKSDFVTLQSATTTYLPHCPTAYPPVWPDGWTIFQYSAIYNNVNLTNSIICQYWFKALPNSKKIVKKLPNYFSNFAKVAKLRQVWSHCYPPTYPTTCPLTYLLVLCTMHSTTRLGDLLHLGQLFKAFGTIISPKLPTFLGNFCKCVISLNFSSEIIFGATFIDLWQLFYWSHWRCTTNQPTFPPIYYHFESVEELFYVMP